MLQENAADTPFFKALLVPYRSLGRTGFYVLMGSMVAAWVFVVMVFYSMGAWPIIGFFGLDVAALYLAFRINYRAANVREEIALSRTSLNIRKVPPSGRVEEHSVNPLWTRFTVRRGPENMITDMSIEARGMRISIGSFLNPDDRESFASAFGQALATAKRA